MGSSYAKSDNNNSTSENDQMEHSDEVNQVDEKTREKIHGLLGEYLGGNWNRVAKEELIIKRVK